MNLIDENEGKQQKEKRNRQSVKSKHGWKQGDLKKPGNSKRAVA